MCSIEKIDMGREKELIFNKHLMAYWAFCIYISDLIFPQPYIDIHLIDKQPDFQRS